jgi:hypothetical protein
MAEDALYYAALAVYYGSAPHSQVYKLTLGSCTYRVSSSSPHWELHWGEFLLVLSLCMTVVNRTSLYGSTGVCDILSICSL